MIYLDRQPTARRFIINELDSTHLFVVAGDDIEKWLTEKIDEWHDRNSFSSTLQEEEQESAGGSKNLAGIVLDDNGKEKDTKRESTTKRSRKDK